MKKLSRKHYGKSISNFLLFISFFSLVSVNAIATNPFSGGTGSAADPYQITTIVELDSMHNYLDSCFVLMNDLDFNGSIYDSINSTEGWIPLGNSSTRFTGTFDGAGYTISNLYINRSSTNYIGLFGYTNGAIIDSVKLINCDISGGQYTGTLVGLNYSTTSNCFATGTVSGSKYTGGLVGYNSGLTLSNCYANSNVFGGSYYSGGLVGYSDNSTISDCYATGKVTGASVNGGLVGYNKSTTISNCYSVGIVSGGSYLGGLIGSNDNGTLTNAYYNTETCERSIAMGYDNNSQTATGLTIEEMKQQSNFTGFDFTTVWAMTDNENFPMLQSVYNGPVILHDLETRTKINVLYKDTVRVVPMDNNIITLTLADAPAGMQLQDSIITWTPDSLATFSYSVIATDANMVSTKYTGSILVVPFDGAGTTGDPYQITTIDELSYIHNCLDCSYILMNNLDFSGSSYSSGSGWEPIGTVSIPFTGSLNGSGHTIDNLYINRSSTNNIGLIGYTDGSTVENLGLINCYVKGMYNVGALVANNVMSSTITNCYTTGVVIGNDRTAGIAANNSNSSSISNCYSEASASSSANNAGGVVAVNNSSSVSNCYATGKISGSQMIGGLVGDNSNSSPISNCYATGEVSGSSSVGGLVGYNSNSTVSNSYATGKVTGGNYVGGFVGGNYYATESNCYAVGSVSGNTNTAGFVGYNSYSTLTNAYYNTETCGQSIGIGWDNNSQTATGLTIEEMKQQSNFTGFDFTTVWTIIDNKNFPRLQSVYNAPVILHDFITRATINVIYKDTILVVLMDNNNITLTIENVPNGMLLQDSIISWTPDSLATFSFSVIATDANMVSTKYTGSILVTPFAGVGTADNPFQVTTIDELYYIRNCPADNYILMNDLDFDGSAYDNVNSTLGWLPLGNSSTPFTGSFDGDGHTISNLYINRPSTNYIGLFGNTSGAVIKNLGLMNSDITGAQYSGGMIGYNSSTTSNCFATGRVTGSQNTGGLVGYNSSSTISSCYATCEVVGTVNVGGLLGYNSSSSVSNCYTVGSVSGNTNAGGFVGTNAGATLSNVYYNTETCGQSSGIGTDNNSQTATGLTTEDMKQQGNFTGFDFTNIWTNTDGETFPHFISIYNSPVILQNLTTLTIIDVLYKDTVHVVPMDNNVITLTMEGAPTGMLLQDSIITWTPDSFGEFTFTLVATDANLWSNKYKCTIVVTPNGDGTVSNPYKIVTINDLNALRELPDGYFILMNDLDFNGSVYDSINSTEGWEPIGNASIPFTGSFNGSGHTISNLYIKRTTSYIGLFGYTNGANIDSVKLMNCNISGGQYAGSLIGYNYNSSTISNCYATFTITGSYSTGGLVGYNTNSSALSNCFANGIVSGIDDVGGLVGYNIYSSTLSNCFASGKVSGRNYIGGLVGLAYAGCSISNCYATGDVTGEGYVGGLVGKQYSTSTISESYSAGSTSGNTYTGGFIGDNEQSTLTNTYCNSETSGQSNAIGYDNNAQTVTWLTSNEMKLQSNFTGFNFTTVWTITDGETFPRLQSVYNPPFILHDLETRAVINVLYKDTVRVVPMDNNVITLTLQDAPVGMQIQDSIITWTPDTYGVYTFTLVATDANLWSNQYKCTVVVTPNGQGTEANPYEVTTIEELDAIRYLSNDYVVLMNDLDFSGSIYDSNNSVEGWEPIGTNTHPFRGNFNGNGHIINSLYINSSNSYTGLFGYISGATIDSIGITNCNVTGISNVGGLVGYAYSSSISNCYTTGKVTGESSVGGLVGFSYNSSTISNCYANCDVSGGSYIGGLVGFSYYASAISNCYSVGKVNGNSNVGGLLGRNYYSNSTVTNSYYNTETSGQSNGIGIDDNSQTVTGLTTLEMKQQSNFTGFDFTNIWTITNAKKFPRLNAVYDIPMILSTLSKIIALNDTYIDTIDVVRMDNDAITFSLESAPTGMQLQDSVITFTPNATGVYSFIVDATDANLFTSKYQFTLVVKPTGDGTQSNPYQITTIEELNTVRYLASDYFILMNDLDFTGSEFDNINSTKGWDPIGDITSPFSGSFNGDGHSISNLFINSSLYYVGLFGYIDGATIDSLGINNCNITGGYVIGGLAGYTSNSSTISNCYVTGEVTSVVLGDDDVGVGGLVGNNYSSNISDCHTEVKVLNNNEYYYTGGLVGFNYNSSPISNCYATGDISSYTNAGGLVGWNGSSSPISNCYATGDVTGIITENDESGIGGLIGYNYSSAISSCYATGNVSGDFYTGGLVGWNDSQSPISDCFVTGDVSGSRYIGGLLGYNSSASPISNCYSSGNVLGSTKTGGFIGENFSLIINSFYDTGTSGLSAGIGAENNGQTVTGINTLQFNDTTNYFTGWNFDTVWHIAYVCDIDTVLRPYLSWQNIHKTSFIAGANGSISGDTVSYVGNGCNALTSVTAVPDATYHFVEWQNAGGASITNDNPLTLTNVISDSSLVAIFSNLYDVNFTAGINGSISGTTPQIVINGSNATAVTAIPDANYHFVKWQTSNGDSITNTNPLTVTNVVSDTSLVAVFEIDSYQVSLTTGTNGSITGDTSQVVNHGSDATAVTAVPDANYHFVEWQTTSGDSITNDNPLTVTNVVSDTSLVAVFEIDSYNVSFTAGANGSITGTTSQVVNHGSDATAVTAVPDAHYHFVEWQTTSGDSITNDNPLTMTNVVSDSSLVAIFEIDSYDVSFTAGANGSITGTTSQVVNHGSDATAVTAVPDAHYHFVEWQTTSGDSIANVNPLTLTNVVNDTSLVAVFEIDSYNVNFTAGANGSITGTTSQVVNHGSDATAVTAVPDAHYHFVEWQTTSGDSITNNNPLTVTQVISDSSLVAIFEIDSYQVNFTAGTNGSISGETFQIVSYGSNATAVTAIPDANYRFVEWQTNGGDSITNDNPLTITNVLSDSSLIAIFELYSSINTNNETDRQLSIWPNPASNQLTIEIENMQTGRYAIFNIDGRIISMGLLTGDISIIDVSLLKGGIYLLNVNYNSKAESRKLIIK